MRQTALYMRMMPEPRATREIRSYEAGKYQEAVEAYDKALDAYHKALELKPEDADIWADRSQTLRLLSMG